MLLPLTRSTLFCAGLFSLGIAGSHAGILSPAAGISLPSDTITVTWEPNGTEYWIRVRDLANQEKIHDSGRLPGDVLSHTFTVSEEIVDIDLQFYEKVGGEWQSFSQLHDVSQLFPPVAPPLVPPTSDGVVLTSLFVSCEDPVSGGDLADGYFCAADCPRGYLAIATDTPSFNVKGTLPDNAFFDHAVEGFGTPTVVIYPIPRQFSTDFDIELETRFYYTCLRAQSVSAQL